jgi:rod shape-determining protein MreD
MSAQLPPTTRAGALRARIRSLFPSSATPRALLRRAAAAQAAPQQMLRPVRPGFIWGSVAGAFFLDLLPWGQATWVPDFLALTLVFWNVQQPRRVGMGIAFVAGLLMDVHDGALFGEHALAYTLLSYGAISLHRRIQWFPMRNQCIYVFGLLLVAQLASAAVRLWAGAASPGWSWGLVSSIVGALFWPIATAVLLAPQRRPEKRDDTRPL